MTLISLVLKSLAFLRIYDKKAKAEVLSEQLYVLLSS